MAQPLEHPTTSCHVVAVPYPGRGHINPMLNLCTALADKIGDIIITFIITEEWVSLIDSAAAGKSPKIRFSTIPNILPSELVRGNDPQGFWKAVMIDMEEPVEQLLDRLPLPPAVMIADTLPWVGDLADRKNIQLVSLWPMSASIFTLIYHLDLLVQNGHFPINLSENGDDIVDYIPGLSPIRGADLPKVMRDQEILPVLQGLIPKAKYLVFTSFYELEAQALDTLKQNTTFSIYNIGPSDSYSKLKHINSTKFNSNDQNEYMKWLDLQPSRSVLYISLGSFLSASPAQMDEIGIGIRESGVRYLLVTRGESLHLNAIFGEKGLIVSWCDQLSVLGHPSIGGFWSHCGWNSTKEALLAGVPLLTFPLLTDQYFNAKVIADDWQVGWRVKREFDEENLATRDEIADIVGRFMDLESEERGEISRNARELQKICEKEFEDGQSFQTNLDDFIKLVL